MKDKKSFTNIIVLIISLFWIKGLNFEELTVLQLTGLILLLIVIILMLIKFMKKE